MIVTTRRVERAVLAMIAGTLTLLAVGIPTAVVPNTRYVRVTPTRPQDYLVLALVVVLAAALGATLASPFRSGASRGLYITVRAVAALLFGSYLATLAVGCPTCNGLVVHLLGEQGARSVLPPLQPALALGALLVLGWPLALTVGPEQRSAAARLGAARLLAWRRSPAGAAIRRRWVWRVLPLAVVMAVGLGLVLRPAAPALSAPLAADFTLPVAAPVVASAHRMLALHSLRGHAVLLNFFNTQCPPCIAEMPTLRRTARTYRTDGVIVLGVATGGDTVDTARQFARAQHLTYPVVADEHQDVAWRYEVAGWPTSFFLDARGHVRAQYSGPLDGQTVRAGLARAGAVRCDRCGPVRSLSVGTIYLGAGTPAPADAKLNADVVYAPPRAAPPFALHDQRGMLITPGYLHGRIVALTFVSAACTSQCPLVGEALGQVRRALGPIAPRLSIVAISIDPERDSARTTRQFAARAGWNGTDWHYLTASRALLARVWSAYGELVGPPPKRDQDPLHMAGLYLVDPHGRLRLFDNAPFLAPRVAATIRALLAAPV